MIRTALIHKAANPQALKGEDKQQLPVFWLYYTKKAWTARIFYWIVFISALSLESGSTPPARGLSFKVLLISEMPWPPECHEFSTEGVKVICLPFEHIFSNSVSELLGETSVTSDMQTTPPLWQKMKRN